MDYIIFGCGVTGRKALPFLGEARVRCFASNHLLDAEGYRRQVDGKDVIPFEEMTALAASGEAVPVIATEKYASQLGAQLREAGINRYFVFRESDAELLPLYYPGYWQNRLYERMSYSRILSLYEIERYHKIAIYGDNEYLPYLIMEIAFRVGFDRIAGVIQHSDAHRVRSMGLPVLDLEEAWNSIDCMLVNIWESGDSIRDVLFSTEHRFAVADLYDLDKFIPEFRHPELARYKDIHKGKRIFLVGNGPSLSFKDLDTLHQHGEICFGFNAVFRAFDRAEWRPDYLGITDMALIMDAWHNIPDYNGEMIIVENEYFQLDRSVFPNKSRVHLMVPDPYPNKPQFSGDVTAGVYHGNTTTYNIGLQFAAYMGASEIYLVGVDNTYLGKNSDPRNHFIKDYLNTKELEKAAIDAHPSIVRMDRAYERAEEYSHTHGFRIYNATRGGKLEAFERVDFDSLF